MWKKLIPQVLVISIAVICGLLLYNHQNAIASNVLIDLRREFTTIAPAPNTTLLEQKAHHKPGSAFVEVHYSTATNFQVIADHYSAELKRTGWTYVGTRTLPSKIEVVEFCKGSYAASVDHYVREMPLRVFWFGMDVV